LIPVGKPSAALDPFGLFVGFIILVNIISTFMRRARQQARSANAPQANASPPTSLSPLDDAMRKSTADLAAAREAQRARLARAMQAAQARVQRPVVATASAQAPAPMVQAAAVMAAPPASETLPAYDFDMGAFSTISAPVSTVDATPLAPAAFPVLGSSLTGMQLFVASAIVGPPAALRTVGHTPAGW